MSKADLANVKALLTQMQQEGILTAWELPCENILTRLSAAIFFIAPNGANDHSAILRRLSAYPTAVLGPNPGSQLSALPLKLVFPNDHVS